MAPNTGFETDLTIDGQLLVLSIRILAQKLVGHCTDGQIIFCARFGGRISRGPQGQSLEHLSLTELQFIDTWLRQ